MVNGAKQAISTDLFSIKHVRPRRKNMLGRRSLFPPLELMWDGGGPYDAKSTFALLNSIIVLYTDTMRSFDHCFGDFLFTQDLERRHSESAGEKSILECINRLVSTQTIQRVLNWVDHGEGFIRQRSPKHALVMHCKNMYSDF